MNPHYSSIVESVGCLLDDATFWKKMYQDQAEVTISTKAKLLEAESEIRSLQEQLRNHLLESKNRELPIPYRR